jgi:hypothetical protein
VTCIASPGAGLQAQFITLAAGRPLHQVYDSSYPAGAFHPGTGPFSGGTARPTRFAPLRDATGELVPYLYAGGSLQCALFETLFHDVDFTAAAVSLDLSAFRTRAHALLTLRRDLQLVKLHGTGLNKLKVTRLDLIESPARCYGHTAAWAAALHQQFPGVDGLAWKSRRLDDQDSVLLFGDRVAPADLAAQALSGPLGSDVGLRQRVFEEAAGVGLMVF